MPDRSFEKASAEEARRWKAGDPKSSDSPLTGAGTDIPGAVDTREGDLVPMTPNQAGLSEAQAWKSPGQLTDARRAATTSRDAQRAPKPVKPESGQK